MPGREVKEYSSSFLSLTFVSGLALGDLALNAKNTMWEMHSGSVGGDGGEGGGGRDPRSPSRGGVSAAGSGFPEPPSTSEDLHAWSIYRQNLNSDFTDSALGSQVYTISFTLFWVLLDRKMKWRAF